MQRVINQRPRRVQKPQGFIRHGRLLSAQVSAVYKDAITTSASPQAAIFAA
jgi:hypothetical protein